MRAPEFWKSRTPLALLLAPLGCLYGLSVAKKARSAVPYKSSARIICVGNLTAGGSGKTPVAMAIGEKLIARGKKVFFLARGYGGSEAGPVLVKTQNADAVGDEALLLARTAPTIVARDRAAGAKLAESRGADVIVMDDGHQNFSLAKDLSLVVVDGEAGFGNGLMIPAGPLREPVAQGLARANAVIVVGSEERSDEDGHAPKHAQAGEPDLKNFAGPVLRAHLVADGAAFAGRRVFAFAGIGRPEKFVRSLQGSGAIVTDTQFFADHHPYSAAEIAALRRRAGDASLVTTEKDFVRLGADLTAGIEYLPVGARFDAPALLDSLLAGV